MGLFDFSPRPSKNLNDGKLLFNVAITGIDILQNRYKPLTNEGELEAIIYNSLTILQVYHENHPTKFDANKDELICKDCGVIHVRYQEENK